MFFKGSRYEKVATNQFTDSTGAVIVYKKIRFIPLTIGIGGSVVKQGERLDQISNRMFRDANTAMWPDDLAVVARTVEIPTSEG